MLLEQLEIQLDSPSPTLSEIKHGETFFFHGDIYLKVRPVSFILNSSLVAENLARGKSFCVNLETGTLHCFEGSREVERVNAKIQWSK